MNGMKTNVSNEYLLLNEQTIISGVRCAAHGEHKKYLIGNNISPYPPENVQDDTLHSLNNPAFCLKTSYFMKK